MPVPYRDVTFGAHFVESVELVVDQCFKRRDVQGADRCRRVFRHQGEDREECGFGFAGGGGRAQQHVLVGAENRLARRDLDAA